MPASSRSTTPPVTGHAHEVDPETALQRRLGLRPTSLEGEAPAADQRPCPSWCEVVTDPRPSGLGHELNPDAPSYSTHTLYPAPCLHVLTRAVPDTTGHQEALRAPRMGRPVGVLLSTQHAPGGAETASPVVILEGREMTLQQTEDLASALVSMLEAAGSIR